MVSYREFHKIELGEIAKSSTQILRALDFYQFKWLVHETKLIYWRLVFNSTRPPLPTHFYGVLTHFTGPFKVASQASGHKVNSTTPPLQAAIPTNSMQHSLSFPEHFPPTFPHIPLSLAKRSAGIAEIEPRNTSMITVETRICCKRTLRLRD